MKKQVKQEPSTGAVWNRIWAYAKILSLAMFTLLAVVAFMTATAAKAQITIAGGNGSFETNNATAGNQIAANLWVLGAITVPGWTFDTPGGDGRWFMSGYSYGAPSQGQFYLNLGVDGGAFTASTEISGLTVGQDYKLHFDSSARPGGSAPFTATINLVPPLVTTIPAHPGIPTPYAHQVIAFTATATSHTLTLDSTGASALVDNFSVVQELPNATVLASSANPSTNGIYVVFTAAVQTNGVTAGNATGSMVFKDGGTPLRTNTVSSGVASFRTGFLAVGSHSMSAEYSGDLTYPPSSNSPALIQVVNAATGATTTTTLGSSANPSVLGSSLTFTGTVKTNGVTATEATGTMVFYEGMTPLSTNTVTSGLAGFSTSALALGSLSFTAAYSGVTAYSPSISATLNQVVQAPTTTLLSSTLNPSTNGNRVTFTVMVQTNGVTAGDATGSVVFKDGVTALTTNTLAGGVATLSIRALAPGSHSITGEYGGETRYQPSTSSPALTQVVNVAPLTPLMIADGNGSFETNTAVNPGYAGINGLWTLDTITVQGWTFDTPGGDGRWFMQLDSGGNYFGEPSQGEFFLNLSQDGGAFTASTEIVGLTVGQNYEIHFDASIRGLGFGAPFTATIDLSPPQVTTIQGLPPIVTGAANYAQQVITFTASAISQTLILDSKGTSSLVDNFSVVPGPPIINYGAAGGSLTIGWPGFYLGWILQGQTNAQGIGTNWVDIPGTAGVTSTNLPITQANPAVFYRLRQP